MPEYIRLLLDEVTGANRGEVFRRNILIASFFTILTGFALYFTRRLIISSSRKIEFNLRQDLYRKLLRFDFEFYHNQQTGDLISRCTNDLNDVRTLLGPGIMYIPNSVVRIVFFFPVLKSISVPLLAVTTAAMGVVLLFIILVMPRMRPLYKKVQEQIGIINNRTYQVVSGINVVKFYTLEEIEQKRFSDLNKEYLGRQMVLVKFRSFIRPFFFLIFSIIEIAMLLVGGREIINGSMTLGELLQFNTMISILIFPVLSFGWVMSILQQGLSAMERINLILEYPVEEREDWHVLDKTPLTYTVSGLNFVYPGSKVPAIKRVSLSIRPGEVIGITGGVGSGKTTLLNILSGILKPDRGMVFINGTDIRDIQPESLLSRLKIVPQEPFLFSAKVKENIGLGETAGVDMEEVRFAAEMAAMDGDIEGFNDNYDQMVGERGITLSGGQKQRISIARAWRKEGQVMIFDDSLSSVDSKTAERIIRNISTLKGEKTVIIVSHRIDVIKESDIIYVLHNGEIAEQGTHDELVLQRGKYAKFRDIQNLENSISRQGSTEGL